MSTVTETPDVAGMMTGLPVATDARLWPVVVVGMDEPMGEREKKSPDGRATYRSGAMLRSRRADGTARIDKAASVHVIDGSVGEVLALGRLYQAQGRVWVQPYQPDGSRRFALSITVERLVPVEEDAS